MIDPTGGDLTFAFDTFAYGTPYGIGVVPGQLDRPEATRPTENYAADGATAFWSTRNAVLSQMIDDVTGMLGPQFYELMALDSEISSSLNTLVDSVMAEGIVLSPRVTAMPETPTEEQPAAADIDRAAQEAEFCQRSLDRAGCRPGSPTFDRLVAMQYKYGLIDGHRLAEPRLELAEDGPDRGRYVLASYRLIDNRTWSFVIDRHGDLVGYLMFVPEPGGDPNSVRVGVRFLEPSKFVLFANEPHRSDPRGASALRPCWPGWTLKVTLMPIWHAYLQLFASAKVILIAPPNLNQVSFPGKDGGKDIDPAQKLLQIAVDMRSNTAAVVPHGTEPKLMEARSDGQPFKLCVQEVDRENAKAILGSPRVNSESEYGSRADSQTGKDLLDIKVRLQKRGVAQIIERVCYYLLEVNEGAEYAARFCPIVSLGDSGQENFPAVVHAYCEAMTTGILTPDQRPAICRRLRFPMPSSESVEQSTAAHAAATNPAAAPPPGGQTGRAAPVEPDNPPTKAKPQEAA